MLILLPPSEGKSHGGDGAPVDLASLSWPALTKHRQKVATALVTVCQRNPKRARKLLGLSEALDADRAANAELEGSPTMPAGHRYSGILHDALGYPTLPAAARRRADTLVIVFSGLWGAVRPTDLLPAYRIGIGTNLTRIGPLPTYWRAPLLAALADEVAATGALDLRSSGYSQMFRPAPKAPTGLVPVAITGPDGKRAAASYQSKVAKGRLAREMLRIGTPSVDVLLRAADAIGLNASARPDDVLVSLPDGWGLIGSGNP